MKKSILSTLVLALAFSVAGIAQTTKFDASNSELKWVGKKVTGEHTGTVALKSGSLTIEKNKITAGKFVIDMTTINDTDMEAGEWHDKLNGHLRSDDFFGVEKFPEAVLTITVAKKFENNEAQVDGNLTIKGITQPVSFKVVQTADGYTTTITVNRTKYGIQYGSGSVFEGLGDKMIYDDFTLDVKLKK